MRRSEVYLTIAVTITAVVLIPPFVQDFITAASWRATVPLGLLAGWCFHAWRDNR